MLLDYLILIDTSYSMLLDPEHPARALDELAGQFPSSVPVRGGSLFARSEEEGTALRSGLLRRVQGLAAHIVDGAPAGTTIAIYPFNERVTGGFVGTVGETDRREFLAYIDALAAGGGHTAIYDSMERALEKVATLQSHSAAPHRTTIFLFTDGRENASNRSFNEILRRFELLRSRQDQRLFWRYYTPREREAAATPAERRRLEEAGVAFEKIEDLEEEALLGSVLVEPQQIVLDPRSKGPISEHLNLRVTSDYRGPFFIQFEASGEPTAQERGMALPRVQPATVRVQPDAQGRASLDVNFSWSAPEGFTSEQALPLGTLRLTSPQVIFFSPSSVPLWVGATSISAMEAVSPPTPHALRQPLSQHTRLGLILLMLGSGIITALLLWLLAEPGRRRPQVLVLAADRALLTNALEHFEGDSVLLAGATTPPQAWQTTALVRPLVLFLDLRLYHDGFQQYLAQAGRLRHPWARRLSVFLIRETHGELRLLLPNQPMAGLAGRRPPTGKVHAVAARSLKTKGAA